MESYTSFAKLYDTFMDNVPYKQWVDYLLQLLEEQGIVEGIILDLGCGTGNVTELLAENGYDMIGIDNAQEMLQIAMEKKSKEKYDILYLEQDMTSFELFGTVNAVISICDSMNYLVDEEDIKETFKLVNNYLDPGGIFIFDLNTKFKYEEVLGKNTFAEVRENSSFIWDNYYDKEDQINEYQLSLFVKQEETNLYEKFDEIHYQKAYDLEKIKLWIKEAGLEFISAYDAFSKEEVKENSERIYIIARECEKQLSK